jgi:hypothetical protein
MDSSEIPRSLPVAFSKRISRGDTDTDMGMDTDIMGMDADTAGMIERTFLAAAEGLGDNANARIRDHGRPASAHC